MVKKSITMRQLNLKYCQKNKIVTTMKIIRLTESQLRNIVNNLVNENENKMKNPCWKGYRAYGTKTKNGKEVPNCVPINETR